MQEYVTITILGGCHNGQEYNLLKGLTHIQLSEYAKVNDYNTSEFYTNSTTKVHTYRKLDFKFVKDFSRSVIRNSWKELEDLNIFIPNDTTLEYEETLKQVIGKALKANWIPKYEGFSE